MHACISFAFANVLRYCMYLPLLLVHLLLCLLIFGDIACISCSVDVSSSYCMYFDSFIANVLSLCINICSLQTVDGINKET